MSGTKFAVLVALCEHAYAEKHFSHMEKNMMRSLARIDCNKYIEYNSN